MSSLITASIWNQVLPTQCLKNTQKKSVFGSVCIASHAFLLFDWITLGRLRHAFNVAAVLHCSWILRILYPLVWNIQQLPPIEDQENDNPESGLEMEGPPEYQDAVEAEDPDRIEEQPPTYNETIASIRKQLPKLSRSISVSAQRVGRQLSVKQKSTSMATSSKHKVNPTQSLGC